jgi:hypothetical protein
MDESKPSNPLDKVSWPPASHGSALIDSPAGVLANSGEFGAPGRPTCSHPFYCGDEEEVRQRFLVALRAMGIPAFQSGSICRLTRPCWLLVATASLELRMPPR